MSESLDDYKRKIKNFFNNTINVSFKGSVEGFYKKRHIELDGNTLKLDGLEISLPSDKVIIVVNGNAETVRCETGELYISGDVNNVEVDSLNCDDVNANLSSKNIKCKDVYGDIHCESITCEDVDGNVEAKGDVSCKDVNGNVVSGGDVKAEDVNGNIKSNGNVDCEDVNGGVNSKGNVNIKGDVAQYAVASGDLKCSGDIGGDAGGINVKVSGDIHGGWIQQK